MKLEVDAFEIDLETLDRAIGRMPGIMRDLAADNIAREVINNLTQESKKIFEEYQEQNNPCRG